MAADPASAKGANKFLDPDLRPIPASVALLATSVATDAIVLVVYSSCFRSQLGTDRSIAPIKKVRRCPFLPASASLVSDSAL